MLVLISCKKKYEEKEGVFAGGEIYATANYSDTLSYDVSTTTYKLVYNQTSKSYSVISNTGYLTPFSFDRKNFKDNSTSLSTTNHGLSTWNVTLGNDSLKVNYQNATSSDWTTIDFSGYRQ